MHIWFDYQWSTTTWQAYIIFWYFLPVYLVNIIHVLLHFEHHHIIMIIIKLACCSQLDTKSAQWSWRHFKFKKCKNYPLP